MAHFLILSMPIHGTLHPTLHLAIRLARAGARVTYTTSLSAHSRIATDFPSPDGLSYAPFSDGYDDGFPYTLDQRSATSAAKIADVDAFRTFLAQFSRAGSQKISELVRTCREEGRPVTCVVYGMLLCWVADVASDLQIPSVCLWTQASTVLGVYYRYFNGYDHLFQSSGNDRDFQVKLPGLPLLGSQDLPYFLTSYSSSSNYNFLETFRDQIQTIDRGIARPRVLVNTFDDLEPDAIASVRDLGPIPIGPLIPLNLFNGSSTRSSDHMQWLGSNPGGSVVYISFGTIFNPSNRQMEEILNGLLETRHPFLWVVKGSETGSNYDGIRSRVGGSERGLVVEWCSQVEVLGHPSTGCFVTHCGWNSTVESLAMGVPMVCFPQWMDQTTNAKLVEVVWKAGVRVKENDDGIMEGGELKRCLEEVMMMGGGEMKKNAEKWRDSAREAMRPEGGSSDANIRKFVEEMGGRCSF